MPIPPLAPERLCRRCDPERFSFSTTADLEDLQQPLGQPRAVEALRFGFGIEREGYNIFALGPPGTGKHPLVYQVLEERAGKRPAPSDWCYVNNFEQGHRPRALRLPPGRGARLRRDMERLVEEARNALKAAFENEEYQNRRQSIEEEFKEEQQQAFEALQQQARERDLAVVRTPSGLVFAPVREGEVIAPEEFQKLGEEQRRHLEEQVEELQKASQKIFQKIPVWERQRRERLRELNREVCTFAVGPLVDELRQAYAGLEDLGAHLDAVQRDMVDNARDLFVAEGAPQGPPEPSGPQGSDPAGQDERPALRRYRVNLLVEHREDGGAPVVYEDNPTLQNLVGRVEHLAHMGTLATDFTMIKAGSLHRAGGGYLILDALKVLTQPFAWEGLKRALRARQIRIESPGQMSSAISTISLEPEPIPLDLKVVLIGDPALYYLLRQQDPEFAHLFKVAADFDTQIERTDESQELYARLVATLARRNELRPLDRGAVARLVEESARQTGDAERLSIHIQSLGDLLREADYWAGESGRQAVSAADVHRAVEARIYRSDRPRQRSQEHIERGILRIDTEGEKVAQINGLSVLQLGDFAFGRPSRITARVRLGRGEVLDIEREVELGGPLHTKGVLILSGFLGGRYASERPLSLAASLVFEQSYGGVDGDSASSAELYALLSAIAELPIKQSLAVTGSVDQHGQVQAIGGVNEKIEGFFDLCRRRGLSGGQGVLIPAANAVHLMLRRDVVEAVEAEKFHVYAVESIDQGIELLTGVEAGAADERGQYPPHTVNGRVQTRLRELAEKRRAFAASGDVSGE